MEPVARSKQEAKFSLLFKLLSFRQFNGEALKSSVRSLWAGTGGVTIRDIEDNLFLAVFSTKDDLERVFIQSPWTFDKKLIMIVRFEDDMQPTEVKFSHSAFWIRVFNLPIKSMIREVAKDIGNEVGRFIEANVLENGLGWGRFLRVRVEIDITQPLLRGKILEITDNKPFWVDFQYEHMPIFCYRCGRLGHSGHDRVEGRQSGDTVISPREHYGTWLRAVPRRRMQQTHRLDSTPQADEDHVSVQGEGSSATYHAIDTVQVSPVEERGAPVEEQGEDLIIPSFQGQFEFVAPNFGDNVAVPRNGGFDSQHDFPMEFQIGDTATGEGQLFFGKIKDNAQDGVGGLVIDKDKVVGYSTQAEADIVDLTHVVDKDMHGIGGMHGEGGMHGKGGIKISEHVTGPQSSEGSVLKLSTWKRRARSNARMGQGLEEARNRGKRILETNAENESHTVEGSSRKC